MLRINLLPAYIAEQRRVRLAIFACAALFLIVTGAGLGYVFVSLNKKVADEKALEADATERATTEKNYEAATATMLAGIAPIYDKVKFVEQVRFHNRIRQKIFRNAAKYTYRRVEYNSMSVAGNNLALSASVSSLDDIGRFYLLMFGNPDVTAVSFTGVPSEKVFEAAKPVIVPGGAPPAPPQFPIAMNATLVQPVVTPTLPASLGASGAGGGGLGGGMPTGGMPMPGPSGGAPAPMGSGGGGAPAPMGSGGGGAPGPMGSGGGGVPGPRGSG